jgi:hypothetical protein
LFLSIFSRRALIRRLRLRGLLRNTTPSTSSWPGGIRLTRLRTSSVSLVQRAVRCKVLGDLSLRGPGRERALHAFFTIAYCGPANGGISDESVPARLRRKRLQPPQSPFPARRRLTSFTRPLNLSTSSHPSPPVEKTHEAQFLTSRLKAAGFPLSRMLCPPGPFPSTMRTSLPPARSS